MSHHHNNHYPNHSHAHFDEHHNENYSHTPTFSEEGYSNNRFSHEGFSNERFNADALQEDGDPYQVQDNETPCVHEVEDFFNNDYSHDLDHHHHHHDHPSNKAPYGHAFSHEGADQYSHENHENHQRQFLHSHSDESAHSHHSSIPPLNSTQRKTFCEVVPSKTLFGPAFSHSEIPQNINQDSTPESYSQNVEFDEDDQVSNDFLEKQLNPDNDNYVTAPPPVVLQESMSTQTVETKKPLKVTPIMQKCRIISDVTMNYFGKCCLNRKHEIPTRDYGFVPAPRCMPNYLPDDQGRACGLRNSSVPMSVSEIQNRQNLLRMYKQGPVEVRCYNANVKKQDHPLEEIIENEEMEFGTDEFSEVNACHNINNFNKDYPNPEVSSGSSGSFSVCVEPDDPVQPAILKSCLCKKQPYENFYGNQMTGSLRGGGLEYKKVRMNPCSYKKRQNDDVQSRNSVMQDFEKRGSTSKRCPCGINANRPNFFNNQSIGNIGLDDGGGRCKCKNVRLNSSMYKRPPSIREVDENESSQDFTSNRSMDGGKSCRNKSNSLDYCKCRKIINRSNSELVSLNSRSISEVENCEYRARPQDLRSVDGGSLKFGVPGSNTSLNGSNEGYKYLHNLDYKKPSCCSNASSGSVGSGSKKISNSGIEIHINTCCSCKKNEGAEKKDQENACNLCCGSEAEKRQSDNSKSDLYYLCKKEVTKTSCLNINSCDNVSSGPTGRSRSHGDLYCLCSAKKSAVSSRISCCCKNKCGRTKSNNDLHHCRCAEQTKPNRSPCGCCCQKNAEQKIQIKNKCNCNSSCNNTASRTSTSETSTSESDSESQKCCSKNKKKTHLRCSCKKKEEKIKQSCCHSNKQPFQIEFDDDGGSDNQIPIFKVCLCRKSQVTTGSNTKNSLTELKKSSFEPMNSNPSELTGTDDIFYENQNKINHSRKSPSVMTETDDLNRVNSSSIRSKNNASMLIGTDDMTISSWIGSSGGVHRLTDTDCNSFNNSVCTSTNFLAKDKSMQAMSRNVDQMLSVDDEIIENQERLPIVFCNRKCSLLDQNLYEGPFEIETCNPFYLTESQLRVHYKGSEVNILYASNLYADGCNQTITTQDYSCAANLGTVSEGSSTSDSTTINEINVPVLRDQEIQVAQTKHKTRINIGKPKMSREKLKHDCGVCKKNKKIYCCDPPGSEKLPPCLEKIRPKCKCSESRSEINKCKCRVAKDSCREIKPKCKRTEDKKCGKCRDLSEDTVRETKCKCSTENSDEVRKRSKEEKRFSCTGSARKRCNYVVVNSKGEVQSTPGTSRQVRKSSSVELYCAFLKRAEVVFLACSMLFYVFIYKMLTSYAL